MLEVEASGYRRTKNDNRGMWALGNRWHSRRTSTERGYGASWLRLRKTILKRDNYLCQCPDCRGGELRLRPARDVDHILPKSQGGTDDPANLRSVHPECHKKISLQQRGYEPRKKAYRSDGTPKDGSW